MNLSEHQSIVQALAIVGVMWVLARIGRAIAWVNLWRKRFVNTYIRLGEVDRTVQKVCSSSSENYWKIDKLEKLVKALEMKAHEKDSSQ